MAESLIALLLVSGSAGGPNLVFQWPPSPTPLPRLARPRPAQQNDLDNPWRAFYARKEAPPDYVLYDDGDDDYEWRAPQALRDRSRSFPHSTSVPPSAVSSPIPVTPEASYDTPHAGEHTDTNEYHTILGYESKFLAGLLCPTRTMCHQKFELIVDDLAFLGHPVCADEHGRWKFKHQGNSSSSNSRGRGRTNSTAGDGPDGSEGKDVATRGTLQTFHFVVVLDLPDPSSSAIGNVSKYFEVIYEQVAFVFAAVLFQEQVISAFVEHECESLAILKERYIEEGYTFAEYVDEAVHKSNLAGAMKNLFIALSTSSIAYITVNNLPLELQLPPYLGTLLHADDGADELPLEEDEEPTSASWGRELAFAWRLPALAPWKSLLLLNENDGGLAPYVNLSGPDVRDEDRQLADGLLKFLEIAEITLSLAEMASGLDWDLESQVYPTVRWLVQHRRAKVVDVVHPKLKTPFTLPASFDRPLADLAKDYDETFQRRTPSLVAILATLSASSHRNAESHFYAAVVRDHLPAPVPDSDNPEVDTIKTYLEVVKWLLQRDLLVRLHLRIRVVATPELKKRVRDERERTRTRRALTHAMGGRGQRGPAPPRKSRSEAEAPDSTGEGAAGDGIFFPFSPRSARMRARRLSSIGAATKHLAALQTIDAGSREQEEVEEDEEDDDDDWDEDTLADSSVDDERSTLISDPSQATPLERRWLAAMSEGKEAGLKARFDQINQYFDGRKADDEILYRASITRKQLRQVLRGYEEYLETFLHS